MHSELNYLKRLLESPVRLTDAAVMTLPASSANHRHVMEHPKLIYIERGSMLYRFDEVELHLRPGAMLYRPALKPASWDVLNRDGCVLCLAEFDAPCDDGGEIAWSPKCDHDLEFNTFKRLRSAFTVGDDGAVLEAQGELKALLARFFRRAVNPLADDVKNAPASRSAEAAVRKALLHLGQHLRDPDLLERLHEHVGLSEDHLRKVFRQRVGMSAQRYLMRLRMNTARGYLERSTLPVKEVAKLVGYTDPLLFSRMYRRTMGRAPSADRSPKAFPSSTRRPKG